MSKMKKKYYLKLIDMLITRCCVLGTLLGTIQTVDGRFSDSASASHFDFQTCVYFHVYKVAIQTTSRSLVATIITYILTANGDFLSSVKAQRLEGWNLIRFLSAANQNVDQHNDVGPLCLILCLYVWR